jgi:glutamate synthase domain-containing protein 3
MTVTIDASNLHYRELNARIREAWQTGEKSVVLQNVRGQRYIGDALQGEGKIVIEGIPGNDLAVFMDGPDIVVQGNIQDVAANTMNSGSVVVHGSAGDTLGYGMRGGTVYVRDNVGYRAGIHMKEYGEHRPILVIGGVAGDFMGEYMAGGVIMVMNLEQQAKAVGNYCGSGMHGGAIFIRSDGFAHAFKGLKASVPEAVEQQFITRHLNQFASFFNRGTNILADQFIKLTAAELRPYEKLYVGI